MYALYTLCIRSSRSYHAHQVPTTPQPLRELSKDVVETIVIHTATELLHLIYISKGYLPSLPYIMYNGVDLFTRIILLKNSICTFSIICSFSKPQISHAYVNMGRIV